MTKDEALQIALDALELWVPLSCEKEINILRDKLDRFEPEPEPVAWLYVEGLDALKAGKCWTAYGTKQDDDCRFPVYAAPPKREWQGLTHEDILDCISKLAVNGISFARAIEAKLKDKNEI